MFSEQKQIIPGDIQWIFQPEVIDILSCYQRSELINFDVCCLITQFVSNVSQTHSGFLKSVHHLKLWLDIFLWPLFFLVVSVFPLFLLFWRKNHHPEANQNDSQHHNLERKVRWNFCLLVGTSTRFSGRFRLNSLYFERLITLFIQWLIILNIGTDLRFKGTLLHFREHANASYTFDSHNNKSTFLEHVLTLTNPHAKTKGFFFFLMANG